MDTASKTKNSRRWQPRLFITVIGMLWLAIALCVYYQYQRERDFKTQLLTTQLLQLNEELGIWHLQQRDALPRVIALSEQNPQLRELRVTLIDEQGRVLYDNESPALHKNKKPGTQVTDSPKGRGSHLTRPEVRQALRQGTGFCVRRASATLGRDFFYVATHLPQQHLIVRTALPYNVSLAHTLTADHGFLYYALALLLVLTLVFYYQTVKLIRLMDSLQSEEQARLRRQLTLNMSHELKTPVSSIQGYVETLLQHPDVDPHRREAFLRRIDAQTQRLTALLRDITTLTRLDEAPDQLHRTPLDLVPLIRGIADDAQLQLAEREMTLQLSLPPTLPILGHEPSLYSIFRNLVDNAIAYAGRGTTITLTADAALHFTFADNGQGVPPEHLPRLFERFYRVDKGRSRKIGGTGLGLAIVKNAVLLHDGTIQARRPAEGGLAFDFTLGRE